MNLKFSIPCLGLLFGSFCTCVSAAPPSAYDITFLPPSISVSDINNKGQISGFRVDQRPLIWENNLITYLGLSDSTEARTHAINNRGQAAGFLFPTSFRLSAAVVWNNQLPTKLDNVRENGYSEAFGINDAGQVVGTSGGPLFSDLHLAAVVWNGVTPKELRFPDGVSPGTVPGVAKDINNAGQITGWVGNHAVAWDGDAVTILDPSDSGGSQAYAINEAGQVVGWSVVDFTTPNRRATLWSDGKMIDLGTLGPSGDYSQAEDINNTGQIVGYDNPIGVGEDASTATIWDNGQIYDLNSFLDATTKQDGWRLARAVAINDLGQIIGNASNGSDERSFLLTPVPEPDTCAMLMTGLGLIGFAARRRKAASSTSSKRQSLNFLGV